MDIVYNGEHSVMFGDKHSWNDWHLAPTSKPVFSPPQPKEIKIEIPGADGVIDLSTALTGRTLFNNRTASFGFYMVEGYGSFDDRYSEILNCIHGKSLNIVLTDEPDWTYHGRCKIELDEIPTDDSMVIITITVDADPYKTNGSEKSL